MGGVTNARTYMVDNRSFYNSYTKSYCIFYKLIGVSSNGKTRRDYS